MSSLTASLEIGGMGLDLRVVSPSRCSSNLNSSNDVLDPTADCELVWDPLRMGNA